VFDDGSDGGLGLVMSGLSGVAAALAVAIVLTVYFRSGYRSLRDVVTHGLAVLAALGLVAFVAYDMRHAALSVLGINPSKPAVEFEIRLPTAVLSAIRYRVL
jgi:high-affinity Fe2+/Pb2+ permease